MSGGDAVAEITSLADERLQLLNCPEGKEKDVVVLREPTELHLAAPSEQDLWRRTFYTPQLIKDNAFGLVADTPANSEWTCEATVAVTPKTQFDQVGILIYIDSLHWVKAGLEFVDGGVKLSCVVCNCFSDWSTQDWPDKEVRIRVHKMLVGSSVVVEAAPVGSEKWSFIRIAHLSASSRHTGLPADEQAVLDAPDADAKPWRVGPFAACPVKQDGCIARITQFHLGPKKEMLHA
eukprot:m.12682 g.12682  ORF g.12682 m.12682 type:complete len:235 (+) comp4337_c0_seq1:439-1143(+)